MLTYEACCKAKLNEGEVFTEEGTPVDIIKTVVKVRPLLKKVSLLT